MTIVYTCQVRFRLTYYIPMIIYLAYIIGHLTEAWTMSEREEREAKALVIAAKSKLTKKGDKWHVPSQSGYKPFYTVDPNPDAPHCDCPDFEKRGERCKHIFAVEIVCERESVTTTTTSGDVTTTTTTTTET